MKTKLSPPWEIYYKKLQAMFEDDNDIIIVYNPDNYEVKLYVDVQEKAAALAVLLPPERSFGNVKMLTTIIPPNKGIGKVEDVYREAFRGNPVVDRIKTLAGTFKATYIIFVKAVVQYYDDSLADYSGYCSTLYQDIAKDIFIQQDGVYYCTSRDEP